MDPNQKPKALVIEDDPEMADLVRSLLRRRFGIDGDIAPDCASARRMLTERDYDIITLDYRLPDGAGLDLLDEITESVEHPPVIMVTGHGDEETAARSFQSRASGYVPKDAKLPTVLTEAVEKALAEISLKRIEKELLDEKAFIEDALNTIPDLFAVLDIEGNFFKWNRRVSEVTGFSDSELSTMNIIDLFSAGDAATLTAAMKTMKGDVVSTDRVTLLGKSGERERYELSGRVLRNHDGVPIGFTGTGRAVMEGASADSIVTVADDKTARLLEERTLELESAREALRMSNQQASAVLDNSLDLIGTFDSNGRFINCNPACESILGYTNEEFLGRSVFDFVQQDDLEELLESHNQVVGETGATRTIELKFKHKNGDLRTLECVGQSYEDKDGQTFIVVNARDITDRQLAEMHLREREQQLRMITNAMEDVIIRTEKGIVTYVSPSFKKLVGYDGEELVGESVFEVLKWVHEDDRERLRERMTISLNDHVSRRAAFRVVRADGRQIWIETLGTRLISEEGESLGGVITCRDITESKLVDEEIRISEERYRGVFDLSPDYIYLVGQGGVVIDANKALLDRYGLSLEELGSLHFMSFYSGDNKDVVIEAMTKLQANELVRGLEVQVRTPRGENILLEINAVPFFEDGKLKHVLSLARDITDRKRIEDELRRLNTELEGYARTVSHDLRAPLTAIKLAGETVNRMWAKRDEVEDIDGEIRRLSDIIELSTSQAEALITDLLTLAMAGAEPEEVTEVDVTDTVNRIVEERSQLIEEAGAEVTVNVDLGSIRANAVHVYQVFSNFIDNAIKHNHNSHPTVEIIYLGESPAGHKYTVNDNGPGIDPQEAEIIFMPFYKGENGFNGIGLAIVDKIIKLYDGSVHVHNNGGARFEFTMKDRQGLP